MSQLFRFSSAVKRDAAVSDWLNGREGDVGDLARRWFDVLRGCGDDVRELMHDKYPTSCVEDAAFAYVGAFKAHVNVGFFRGADLPDPAGLLEGTGKSMRHVKVRPGKELDTKALERLISAAYDDMTRRVQDEANE